jgi:hypothetical protein
MNGRKRLLWGLAAAVVLAFSAAGAVVATVLEKAGPIEVEVRGKKRGGNDVSLVVPGGAAFCCLSLVPDAVLGNIPAEAAEHLAAARAFCEGIEGRPDFVLCRVENDEEKVLVEKKGEALVVFVDSKEETVRVSIPLWILNRVVARIDRAAGDGSPTG